MELRTEASHWAGGEGRKGLVRNTFLPNPPAWLKLVLVNSFRKRHAHVKKMSPH